MKIFNENCIEGMKKLEDTSIDLIVTDPPYGLKFMGKKWDKALPPKEAFKQMQRVLQPGAFAFIMCTPRSDLQARMSLLLEDAGFNIAFTPIYWTYATGFPKAQNISKQIDKRVGKPQKSDYIPNNKNNVYSNGAGGGKTINKSIPNTEDAKRYNGAYAGYQPKPAVEVVIVAMKPRSEKTYVDQCLANGHGITYLDDCRIPIGDDINLRPNAKNHKRTKDLTDNCYGKFEKNNVYQDKGLHNSNGRFPANLLVSDDSLNDGKERKSGGKHGSTSTSKHNLWNENEHKCKTISDSGSYSRYFDLDAWFAIIPKPSKKEKNQGLEYFEDISTNHFLNNNNIGKKTWRVDKRKPDGGYYVEVKPTKNQNIMFIVCAPYITHHHTLIQTDQKTLKTIVLLFFH